MTDFADLFASVNARHSRAKVFNKLRRFFGGGKSGFGFLNSPSPKPGTYTARHGQMSHSSSLNYPGPSVGRGLLGAEVLRGVLQCLADEMEMKAHLRAQFERDCE